MNRTGETLFVSTVSRSSTTPSAGLGTAQVAPRLVWPGSLDTFAPNRGRAGPFFRRRKRIDPHYLGVVDYVTGRCCPTSAGLKTPRHRSAFILHPRNVSRDAKTRVTSSRSRVVPVDMATRCARDLPSSSPLPVHPLARRVLVFTISISHLIRHARATGIKYHSADSTSVFLRVPSSSCPRLSPCLSAAKKEKRI